MNTDLTSDILNNINSKKLEIDSISASRKAAQTKAKIDRDAMKAELQLVRKQELDAIAEIKNKAREERKALALIKKNAQIEREAIRKIEAQNKKLQKKKNASIPQIEETPSNS